MVSRGGRRLRRRRVHGDAQPLLLSQPCIPPSVHFCLTRVFLTCSPEYRKHTLSKTLGSSHAACYFLAVTIFSLGILRDQL
jgi:hypothetical protein